MSFFTKEKDDELFSLIESNISAINNYNGNEKQKTNPNALTTEEVNSKPIFEPSVQNSTSALESLKKRMREASLQKPVAESSASEPKTDKSAVYSDITDTSNEIVMTSYMPGEKINTAEEESESQKNKSKLSKDLLDLISNVSESEPEKEENSQSTDTDEFNINKFVSSADADTVTDKASKTFSADESQAKMPASSTVKATLKNKKSLLERCKPFILDDNGKDTVSHSAPTYKLESVADILNSQSKKTLDKLSEKYEISFDDLGKFDNVQEATKKQFETEKIEVQQTAQKTTLEKEVFEDRMPVNKPVKNVQTSISQIISDIDNSSAAKAKEENPGIDETTTIKFTPVSDSDGLAARISISSQTRPIDLTGELTQLSNEKIDEAEEEIRLEENEFEEYIPDEEFTSENDTKRFLRTFSIKKRNSFLASALSLIFGCILGFMKLPFMMSIVLAHTKVSMIICSAILGIIILLNIGMFKSLPKIFGRHSNADINASLASIAVLAYCVFGIFKNEITLDLAVLLAFILFIRALSHFFKDSYMLSNFKQISVPAPKRAIKLIGDPAITFAMAKNAVDGDTLIAAPQRTDQIGDFMKYSTFGTFLGGKLPPITVLSLVLSLITGSACASYFDGIIYGFYSAAAILCFAALPIVFLIDNLPLYSAAKKLGKVGAMIAGKTGAEHIEMANAVVFSSEDLFPSGTVTLHHMKILAENSVDDTIIRAASLTDCLGSTLSPIFKKIAGTGNISSLPDSDTVKYEDRMGISGWVDNKLLFIGNRTLMEAHGIEVPSVEVDRKILRKGFFPVYVAAGDKACALLVIQYTVRPEIAREMQKVSALGVTLLINNSDPNLTEDMICDYMGLYDDSVKIMSSAGCHMYKNSVTKAKSTSAPAAYKGNPIGLASIINCAGKIKKSNMILSVFYIIAAIIGVILFAYSSFDGSGTLISSITILIYGIVCTAISYILYLMEKP